MAMTLRLTAEQDAMLNHIAEAAGISKQQAVGLAIEEYVTRREGADKFATSYRRLMERYSGLIDDLATT